MKGRLRCCGEALQSFAAVPPPDTRVDSKLILNVEAKEKIARYAAGLVQEGEVIYLDAGTTPLRMIPYLRDKRITIVTTNVLIFQELGGTQRGMHYCGRRR